MRLRASWCAPIQVKECRTGSEAQRSDRAPWNNTHGRAFRFCWLVAFNVDPVAPLRFAPGSAFAVAALRSGSPLVTHETKPAQRLVTRVSLVTAEQLIEVAQQVTEQPLQG